jgi:hypothetical protein
MAKGTADRVMGTTQKDERTPSIPANKRVEQ